MVCIFCNGNGSSLPAKTSVSNSRWQKRSNHVWRRRHCPNCQQTFTTNEAPALDRSLKFNNGDRKEPFVQEKLFLSLYDSLRHRPTALADATGLLQTVLGKLLPLIKDGQLERSVVIANTGIVLKRFDRAAATSYLAFHPIQK